MLYGRELFVLIYGQVLGGTSEQNRFLNGSAFFYL